MKKIIFTALLIIVLTVVVLSICGCSTVTPVTKTDGDNFRRDFERAHPIPNLQPPAPIIPRRIS